MQVDESPMVQIAHFKLEKRDADTGELLEVIEGGDGEDTRVTYRKEEKNGNE